MKLREEYIKGSSTYTIIEIDKTKNATYITLEDSKGKTLTYGKKIFIEKFKENNVPTTKAGTG